MSDDGRADLSDDELRGYMNDVVVVTTGFLFAVFCAFLVVEVVLGPLLAPAVPAFSGSIGNCVLTGTESVCSGVPGARGFLVVAVGIAFSVVWLNGSQNWIRPALAARGCPGRVAVSLCPSSSRRGVGVQIRSPYFKLPTASGANHRTRPRRRRHNP